MLDDGVPMAESKRTAAGRRARRALLHEAGFRGLEGAVADHRGPRAGETDILDACAACWTAGRILRGEAVRVPADPPRDGRGLRMEIWA